MEFYNTFKTQFEFLPRLTIINVKYMNHAVSLLHNESVEIVEKPQKIN